ncbi:MAG: hypothetical protein KKB59_18455 [Spirochaetes bacterium]|nr:hypothetical protein [Spirochaetota bacterium]
MGRFSIKTIALLCVLSLVLSGCNNSAKIDGKKVKPIGVVHLLAQGRYPSFIRQVEADIQYEPCWGNIILGGLFVESIIAPVYFWGFSAWRPVGKITNIKENNNGKV